MASDAAVTDAAGESHTPITYEPEPDSYTASRLVGQLRPMGGKFPDKNSNMHRLNTSMPLLVAVS